MENKHKEKAIELVEEFEYKVRDLDGECSLTRDEAKQCALIFASTRLDEIPFINNTTKESLARYYWINVNQEIKHL